MMLRLLLLSWLLASSALAADLTITMLPSGGQDGQFLTTYTMQNPSASPVPAGHVYIAGQAFRRGDLPPGTYPVFRDPTTHAPLVQQLDEIATRRENSDDNSIRHLVFAVQLPVAIPANGTYTMEIVKQTGSYSATGKQTLAALCAAHALKLDMTDVRNQDDTVRDSGHMVFDVCSNITNTGRDVPRHVAAGPVRDTYIVRGAPTYTSGKKDPLLYVEAYLDLTTSPSDQTSLGPVRHVMRVSSPWMNVSAGSVGNPGSPGPAGFPNDPQAISYRPTLYDGASNILDWSWWDTTVASASNPVRLTGNPAQNFCAQTLTDIGNWTLPNSVAENALQFGQAFRYSTSGTPPAGMSPGVLFADAVGNEYVSLDPNNTKIVHWSRVPSPCHAVNLSVNPTTQGTGNQIFSWRIWQPPRVHWFALDQSGAENWTNGTSRTTSPLLPKFTAAEVAYWKQTGAVPPLKITNPVEPNIVNHLDYNYEYYAPLTIGVMGGSSGTGERSPLGLVSEYFAQAVGLETPELWRLVRLQSLNMGSWSFATMLDERTGRIPAFNNGRPGPNGAGNGTPYVADGSLTIPLFPGTVDIFDGQTMDGLARPLLTSPIAEYGQHWAGGPFGADRHFSNDHKPAYTNGPFQIFGSYHHLANVYQLATATVPPVPWGGGRGAQDDIINNIHFFGLSDYCCEIRGNYWAMRDKMTCAAFGSDINWERQYCNDMLLENGAYHRELTKWADNNGQYTNFRDGVVPPNLEVNNSTFKDSYGGQVFASLYALLRDPLAKLHIASFLKVYVIRCTNHPSSYSSYWCASYNYMANISDYRNISANNPSSPIYQGMGKVIVLDGSEMGEAPDYSYVKPGNDGTISMYPHTNSTFNDGDMVKSIRPGLSGTDWSPGPDQLVQDTWYKITQSTHLPDGTIQDFKVIDPATNQPFTSFTYKGTPMNQGQGQLFYLKIRPINPIDSPPTGFASGYMLHLFAAVKAIKAVGFGSSGADAIISNAVARGWTDPGQQFQRLSYDPNTVVP